MGWREQTTWKKRGGAEGADTRPGGERGEERGRARVATGSPGAPKVRSPDQRIGTPGTCKKCRFSGSPPRPPEAETPGRGRVSRVTARLQGARTPAHVPGPAAASQGQCSSRGSPGSGGAEHLLGLPPRDPPAAWEGHLPPHLTQPGHTWNTPWLWGLS